jgi:hypothetical protein
VAKTRAAASMISGERRWVVADGLLPEADFA